MKVRYVLKYIAIVTATLSPRSKKVDHNFRIKQADKITNSR